MKSGAAYSLRSVDSRAHDDIGIVAYDGDFQVSKLYFLWTSNVLLGAMI